MSSARFVGRHRELSLLADLVDAVRVGVGGIVAVEGQQGIGKTALLRAGFGGASRFGCLVLWASAEELGRVIPLRLMLECVGPQGGTEPAADGLAHPAFGTDPVLAGAERLLAEVDRLCAASPVVLVAEDLHWADEASVLVWDQLSQAAGQMPLLLAGSWRPDAGRVDLERVGRAVARGGELLRLGPLPARHVTALVADLVGGRPGRRLADLVAQAEGNPLYARELADGVVRAGLVRVNAGVAEVEGASRPRTPQSLAAAITDRLAALALADIDVLRCATVLGAEFSARDLEVVTGLAAVDLRGALAAATAAGVLDLARERLSFRHGLIQQVLYEGIPAARREALHLQAARALLETGAPPERVAAQLAAAPQAAGAREWVWEWLAGCAGTLTFLAPTVAQSLLRQALARMPEEDSRREALETSLVRVAFLLVSDEELERVAQSLLARTPDPDRAAEASWLLGYALSRTGRHDEAVAVMSAALARPGIEQAWVARLRARLAMTHVIAGHADHAADLAEQALAGAERTGDRFAAGYALHALSVVAYHRRDRAGCLRRVEQALAVIGDDPQTTDLRLLLLANRANALADLDRQAEVGPVLREALALAERAGTPRLGTACIAAAEHYYDKGHWDDALAVLETAARMPAEGSASILMHAQAALIAAGRDDWDVAQSHLAAADEQSSSILADRSVLPWLLRAKALAAERAGRPGEAVAVLAQCLDPELAADMPSRDMLMPALARAALDAGDVATAAAAARAAAEEAEHEPEPIKVAHADHCRGLTDDDPAPVLSAAAYFESAGLLTDRAVALEDAAVLLARHDNIAAARRTFTEATGLYRAMGARWNLRRAQDRLSRYGIRLRPPGSQARPTKGWEALTPTELRVAHLVAQGLSNPDIAAELFLSRNTVQTHVSHILAKLQARSRADIRREALRAAWQPTAAEHPEGAGDHRHADRGVRRWSRLP